MEGKGGSVVESKKILKIDPGSNTQVHIDEINESVTEKKIKNRCAILSDNGH